MNSATVFSVICTQYQTSTFARDKSEIRRYHISSIFSCNLTVKGRPSTNKNELFSIEGQLERNIFNFATCNPCAQPALKNLSINSYQIPISLKILTYYFLVNICSNNSSHILIISREKKNITLINHLN